MPKRIPFFLLVFILLLTFSTVIFATNIYSDSYADSNGNMDIHNTDIPNSKVLFRGNNIKVDHTFDQMVVFMGNDVQLDGEYNGDVFVFAQSCELKGTFHKNVTVCAITIKDTSTIDGNLYALGTNGTFSGTTQTDAIFFGQQLTLEKNANIGRDVFIFANDAKLDGRIGRNLSASTTTIVLNGNIPGTIDTKTGQLSIEKNATLTGAITNHSPNEAKITPGATLSSTPYWDKIAPQNTTAYLIRTIIATITTTIIVWLGLRFLAPRLYTSASSYVHRDKFAYVFAIGVGLFILMFLLTLILMFPSGLIGLSFGFFYSALLMVAPAIAIAMISNTIGKPSIQSNFPLELALILLFSVFYSFVISLNIAFWFLLNFFLSTLALGFIGLHVLEQNRTFRSQNRNKVNL